MASSSYKAKRDYDVFLSFKGTDIRSNFLSHLYMTLNQNGLFTYIDSEELRKGEQISLALMKAIEESRVAMIIFSEDYASSPCCLEELVKIMECKEQKNLVVLPVFYKVESREVRQGRKSYRKAMAKHKSKFGKDSEKVNTWKKALFDAGNLSGWDLKDGDEATLIKEIVKEISKQLKPMPLHVAKHPVGIHRRVEELETMLNLESNEVLMIGLWGQGGIGKTTLAKALYNSNFRQFEGACFLRNVREDSKDSKDLLPLQKKLLEMLLGKKLKMFSVDEGITLIQARLCFKKVFLVLDDVDDVKQLNALAGECDWFGKGSRIIITARDNHLLTSHGIDKDHIYAVKPLNNFEALELFNKHAFPRYSKIVIRRDLVDANGLPLALEILSSFLCGREELEWESALNKLAKSPNKIIEDIIKKISDLKMYDVFLSFRGKDVREYFVKGLNEALVQKGIKTFMDSENLLMGQDFPSKLKEAIEQSHMYVVVFSENYAESWWCLKELVQIQGEKNRTKQLLPIFYKVAPGEVRGQNPREVSGKKQSYEKALTDHESEFGKRKVKKWKEALSKAANVNGIHLHDGNMHGCVPRIVKEMEKMMQRIE